MRSNGAFRSAMARGRPSTPAPLAGPRPGSGKGLRDLIENRRNEYPMLDSAVVRVYQQATPGRGASLKRGDPAVGRSRGGLTTRATWPATACGAFARRSRPEPRHARRPALLESQPPKPARRPAYDANSLRRHVDQIGAQAVIPLGRSPFLTIRSSANLEIASSAASTSLSTSAASQQYDRIAGDYLAFVHLATIMLWLR